MATECNQKTFAFHALGQRDIVARFDGGTITSDGGGLLLREAERLTGVIRQFAACFTDHRDPDLIEHTVEELIGQRVYGLALGYEDLNDHDELRHDPMLAVLVGKEDPTGHTRSRERDRGKALAGKSTLNRLELTPVRADKNSRYKKITVNREAVNGFFVDVFLQSFRKPPERIVLDLDATDDPIHGHQLGRFFHGYYKNYCYLPLYIFCGEHLLCARLRPSDIDASTGSVKELERIVSAIRAAWPAVRIVIRGDSGFCREHIMRWCEENDVDFVLGLAKNDRLKREIEAELRQAEARFKETGEPARVFKDFMYQTRRSWTRPRRVVGKAEHLAKGANPRFVVTSLSSEDYPAQILYEQEYCGRGDMENRIKEQQLGLFADRTSCHKFVANQFRVLLASAAYVLIEHIRRTALKGTELAKAQVGTIRLKLFKIAARVVTSVRRVVFHLSSSCPYQPIFRQAVERLVPE